MRIAVFWCSSRNPLRVPHRQPPGWATRCTERTGQLLERHYACHGARLEAEPKAANWDRIRVADHGGRPPTARRSEIPEAIRNWNSETLASRAKQCHAQSGSGEFHVRPIHEIR